MKNLFAMLNKKKAANSGTDIIIELTERNRKFEAFLVEKLADLESKIIPDTTDLSFAEDLAPDTPADTPTESPPDELLLGSSLLNQSLDSSADPDAQAPSPETPPTNVEQWLAGFDDNPPDVDTALPADDGKKDEWS